MNFSGSKKGQAENYFAIIIFIFIFGVLSIIGLLFITTLVDGFSSAGYSTGIVRETGDNFIDSVKLFDYIMVLTLAMLIIGLGISSFRLAATPAGYIVTLVMAGFWGLISYFFNYIFIQIVSNSVFTSTMQFFPITLLICTNLHWVMLLSVVVGSVTLFGKRSKGQFLE